MSEAQLIADVLITLSNGPARLYRLNAGVAWAGSIIERTARRLVLLDYHPVRLAPEGFSDIDGWLTRTITPDMVGTQIAQWVSIETKFGRNKATPVQRSFIDMVKTAGGLSGVAYSVDDARKIITP
jgi:hypothetical protein